MPKVADYRVDQRKFDRRIAARTLDLTYTFVASHSGDKDATHEYNYIHVYTRVPLWTIPLLRTVDGQFEDSERWQSPRKNSS